MKSFWKVFSKLDKIVRETVIRKLDKIVRQTIIRLVNVTDFYPGFMKYVVLKTYGKLGIFRVMHQ